MDDDEECTICGVRQDYLGPCDECIEAGGWVKISNGDGETNG